MRYFLFRVTLLLGVFLLISTCIYAQGDTWETLHPDNSPSPRWKHAMAALDDSSLYAFGGKDEAGNVLDDLYRFKEQT